MAELTLAELGAVADECFSRLDAGTLAAKPDRNAHVERHAAALRDVGLGVQAANLERRHAVEMRRAKVQTLGLPEMSVQEAVRLLMGSEPTDCIAPRKMIWDPVDAKWTSAENAEDAYFEEGHVRYDWLSEPEQVIDGCYLRAELRTKTTHGFFRAKVVKKKRIVWACDVRPNLRDGGLRDTMPYGVCLRVAELQRAAVFDGIGVIAPADLFKKSVLEVWRIQQQQEARRREEERRRRFSDPIVFGWLRNEPEVLTYFVARWD